MIGGLERFLVQSLDVWKTWDFQAFKVKNLLLFFGYSLHLEHESIIDFHIIIERNELDINEKLM